MHSPTQTLIDDLGGNAKVARKLAAEGVTVSSQQISNWKRRGIPHDLRSTVARVAVREDVSLPPRFFDPRHNARSAAQQEGTA